jgi:hypothetical protein
MPQPPAERRQSPRVVVRDRELAVQSRVHVRILDVSLGGVLMACTTVPGTEAMLFIPLGGTPFSASVQLRHKCAAGEDEIGGVSVGAEFVDMNETSRRSLEQFLSNAKA